MRNFYRKLGFLASNYAKSLMNKSFAFVAIILLALVVVVSGCIGQSSTPTNQNNQSNLNSGNNCKEYYWYDDTSEQTCFKKEFCGTYMYKGLQTFDTQSACLDSYQMYSAQEVAKQNGQNPDSCKKYYYYDDTDKNCNSKVFCGAYMYQGLHTYDTKEQCQSAVTAPPAQTTQPTPTPSKTTPSEPPAPTTQTLSIDIKNFAFATTTITINKGDTIIWTNQDPAGHTVTSDSGSELASSTINKGESYTHTFNTVGTFAYHCIPHSGMKATVVVMDK